MALATPLATQLGGKTSGAGSGATAPKMVLTGGGGRQGSPSGQMAQYNQNYLTQGPGGNWYYQGGQYGYGAPNPNMHSGAAGSGPTSGYSSTPPQTPVPVAGMYGPGNYPGSAPYGQGVAQANNAADFYKAMYGPQLAQYQQQAADIAFQQSQVGQRYQSDSAYLNNDYGIQQQLMQNEQDRNVGGKYNDLAALNKYLDTLYGQKTNELNVNKDYLSAQGRMADVGLRGQMGNLDAQRALAGRGFGQAYGAANTAYDQGIRDVYGNGASGAFGTAQSTANMDMNTTRNQQIGAAELSRDTAYQGLDYQGQQAQLANTQEHLGLANKANNLQMGYDQYKTGYEKDKADAANQKSYIDSIAADYGLKADQLKAQLEKKLADLGYDSAAVISQLANASASNDAQQQAQAQVIAQQIMQTAGSFSPNRPPSPQVNNRGKTPVRGTF